MKLIVCFITHHSINACGILKTELYAFVKSGAVQGVSRALAACSPGPVDVLSLEHVFHQVTVLSSHSHSVDDFRSGHLSTTDHKLYLSTLTCRLVPTLVFVRLLLTNVGIAGKQLWLRLV